MSIVPVVQGSVEYIDVAVAFQVDGSAIDPTGDAVQVAFQPLGGHAALDFHTVPWSTDTSSGTPVYKARVLLGAAPFALAAGTYQVYTTIADNPEAPILPSLDLLRVTAP